MSHVLSLWKTELGKINEKAGQSLADPEQYENLFPGFQESLKTQEFIAQREPELLPAPLATKIPMNIDRDAREEMIQNESKGSFHYSKLDKPQNGEGDSSDIGNPKAQITFGNFEDKPSAASVEPEKTRKNSLDEFDFDDEIDENIDTSDVNLDDEELLSD